MSSVAYLAPHKASPEYYLYIAPRAPVVEISPEALERMKHYVGQAQGEVGWLGTVTKTPAVNANQRDHYYIDQVYLFGQRVHSTTTEISADSIAEMTMDFLAEDGGDLDRRANRIRLWGHSHVNMETNPSGQDNAQMVLFGDNHIPYMLRLIANKKGHVAIDVYDYAQGIVWTDVQWSIENTNSLAEEIAREMREKVRQIPLLPVQSKTTYAPRTGSNFSHNSGTYGGHSSAPLGADSTYDRTPTDQDLFGHQSDFRSTGEEDDGSDMDGLWNIFGAQDIKDTADALSNTALERTLTPQDSADLEPTPGAARVRPIPKGKTNTLGKGRVRL